jgi:hypothetical protein
MAAAHAGRETIMVKDIALVAKVTESMEGYTAPMKNWRMLNNDRTVSMVELEEALGRVW